MSKKGKFASYLYFKSRQICLNFALFRRSSKIIKYKMTLKFGELEKVAIDDGLFSMRSWS